MLIQSRPGNCLRSRPASRLHSLTHRSNLTRHFPSQRFANTGNHLSLGFLGPERLVHQHSRECPGNDSAQWWTHVLIYESDKKVRRAATDALAEIGSPQALPELGRALKDQDLVVQRNAAEAIVAIDGEQTLTQLRGAARD
jgi:hypothetical protein